MNLILVGVTVLLAFFLSWIIRKDIKDLARKIEEARKNE